MVPEEVCRGSLRTVQAAPPDSPTALIERDYRVTLARTSVIFERYISQVVLVAGSIALLTVIISRSMGSSVPPGIIPLLALFTACYGGVYALIRKGWWGPAGRWFNIFTDSMLPTAIFILDFVHLGAGFAMSAAGPPLYPIVTLLAVLRLDWRLCLFSGLLIAGQHLAVVLLLLRPSVAPELHASMGLEHYTTIGKTIAYLSAGIFGMLASRALEQLFLRVTANTFERNRVRSLFGMHVSEAVMTAILSGETREEGERRAVTVCFTDIRDFTSLSEARRPEEVVALLNRYFARMCDVVARHGGVVNKFMGDGMLVIFGAPNALENDAQNAYDAALEMMAVAKQMRESGEFPGLRIGIGLHRGDVVAATLGGKQRQEYTVIGDVVNSASRIQSLTRELQRPLLLSEQVRACLPGVDFESLGPRAVKGKQVTLALFAAPEPSWGDEVTPLPVRVSGPARAG